MTFVLDVRRLRVLLAVHERGSIAAAAQELSFTGPAVSQQLAALERQVGVTLIDRGRRRARLTAAGQRLATHAAGVLERLEAAEVDMAAAGERPRGLVRLGTIPTAGTAVLPGAMARLRAAAPELELRVEQMEADDSLPALARGELDAALGGEYGSAPRRLDRAVERHDLLTEPVYVAVPAGHPLTGPEVALERLRDQPWVAPSPGGSCRLLLDRACGQAGFEPVVAGHCADFAMALALVEAGAGAALVPAMAVRPEDRDRMPVRLLAVSDLAVHRTLFMATRRGASEHPALRCLREALANAVASAAPSGGSACAAGPP